MIRPAGFRGAAFGSAADGNARDSEEVRRAWARRLGITEEWAWVRQVHGSRVREVSIPGPAGDGDAIATTTPGLPVTIATADCVPVVLEGEGVAAVVHAGWRGAGAGVIEATLEHLSGMGSPATRAAVGPAIGPCCYEVGPEVAEQFAGYTSETSWGTVSVDLPGAVADMLGDLDVWRADRCTMDDADFHSYRESRTEERQVALAWIPAD